MEPDKRHYINRSNENKRGRGLDQCLILTTIVPLGNVKSAKISIQPFHCIVEWLSYKMNVTLVFFMFFLDITCMSASNQT